MSQDYRHQMNMILKFGGTNEEKINALIQLIEELSERFKDKLQKEGKMIKIKCNTCGFTEEVLVIFEGATCSKCGSNLLRIIKYDYKSDSAKLLRMLRMSISMKKKKGWSRDTGCGFIAQDVKDYRLNKDKTVDIIFTFSDGRWSKFSMWSLNLREAEELLKYIEKIPDVHWIQNGRCINEKLNNICNLGYACDACPWNKDKEGKQ